MNWKLFWKVVKISFGVVFLIAAFIMLLDSVLIGGFDIAYCMFAILTLILGSVMVIFGFDTLPKKE